MKFRKDFVTNSSSSSFVCEICGRTESGWDMGVREAEMYECVNGHTFCMEEALPLGEDFFKYIDELFKANEEYLDEKEMKRLKHEYEGCKLDADEDLIDFATNSLEMYEVPECMCPICQFIEYSQKDMAGYLLKKYGIPREKVFEEVKKFNKRRKKLYDSEYVTYVCKEYNLNPTEIVAGWQEEFGTYANFRKYLGGS
jgi:AraC-like DNA-binding protein